MRDDLLFWPNINQLLQCRERIISSLILHVLRGLKVVNDNLTHCAGNIVLEAGAPLKYV